MVLPPMRLVFGCHSLATLPTYRHARNLINLAWQLGIRSFDTAPLYSKGYSEVVLGELLKLHTGAHLTTKFGCYPNPKPILTPRLALPAHWLRGRLLKRHPGTTIAPATPTKTDAVLSVSCLDNHIHSSLQRLKLTSLDTLLLHEHPPFDLQPELQHCLAQLLATTVAQRVGYGGVVPITWLQSSFPEWLSVLQLALPHDDHQYIDALEKFIDRNPEIEIRLFGLFRYESDTSSIARKWINSYPNCRAVFSCRSCERLRSNVELLLG